MICTNEDILMLDAIVKKVETIISERRDASAWAVVNYVNQMAPESLATYLPSHPVSVRGSSEGWGEHGMEGWAIRLRDYTNTMAYLYDVTLEGTA